MTEPTIEEIIDSLEQAYAKTTTGTWKQGQTSHDTVTENGYFVANFRHANDANFCDHAKNFLPRLLAHIRYIQANQQPRTQTPPKETKNV